MAEKRLTHPPDWEAIFKALPGTGCDVAMADGHVLRPPHKFDGLTIHMELNTSEEPTLVVWHNDPKILLDFLRQAGISETPEEAMRIALWTIRQAGWNEDSTAQWMQQWSAWGLEPEKWDTPKSKPPKAHGGE